MISREKPGNNHKKRIGKTQEAHKNFVFFVFLPLCLLWLLSSLFCMSLNAQVSGGSLSGTVTDASQAAIPGVQVTLINTATGVTRTVATDATGSYTVPDLLAGNYEMTTAAPGFTTQVRTGITVNVGASLVVNVVMQAGDPTRVVRVTVSGTSADQASSTVGGNISTSTVVDSPLNGRDWTQLATLQAGVTGVQTGSAQGGGNSQRGFGAALSISGARPDQNSYRLDGVSINDYSNGAPGSVLGDNLGVDAVEQFSVLGSNYPAEYGRTTGGVINAVTRSGTNAFHGSVYEFLRNSALDARNFFDRRLQPTDPRIPPFKRNQFGGSLGGFFRKDRAFVFADYEGLRQSLGVTQVDTVPSAAARAGVLSTGSVLVDPAVSRFLQAFYPLPNGPLLGTGDTGIFSFAGQQVTTEDYFTTKLDHRFSERDSISGTFMRDNSKVIQPDPFNELVANVVSRRQLVTLREQHIFSSKFLNAARFGFNRAVAIEGGVSGVMNPLLADTAYGFVPGQFVGEVQAVPGITNFTGGLNAERPGTRTSSRNIAWNSFQGADDVFLIKGVHALQFGGLVERMQDNLLLTSRINGVFKFGLLKDFLTNKPRNFVGLLPVPVPTFGIRQTLFGTYLQDDIRLRKNLTINAGIRYEVATVPTEAHGRLSNLLHLTDTVPRLSSPYFLNPTLRNFEPRVGFAWSPTADGKSAIRGGFGIFDVLPLPYTFTLITPFPLPFSNRVFGDVLLPGSFPTRAFLEFAGDSTARSATYIEQAPKRSYVMQWNLSASREITDGLALTVGYVGSRGVHQPFRVDNFDMVLPTLTSAGYLFPPASSSQKLNPNFGRVTGMLWQANSFYDALQMVITKRLSHGLQVRGAYTWGKSIDTLSATVADDAYPNGLLNPLFFDQRTTRGLSDFDVRQTFVSNFTWEVPAPKMGSRLTQWAFGGWQLGGIYKASSGQPFTPLLGGDPLGMKLDETNEPPNRLLGPGCETLTNPNRGSWANPGDRDHYFKSQCLASPPAFPNLPSLRGNLGRNTLIGPGVSKFDASVFKNNHTRLFSENTNVQFRAEFFNLFNRANFASPTDNLTVFDQTGNPIPSAGLITSTQTPSRQIQFALKVIW
jgi:hypothetical protein